MWIQSNHSLKKHFGSRSTESWQVTVHAVRGWAVISWICSRVGLRIVYTIRSLHRRWKLSYRISSISSSREPLSEDTWAFQIHSFNQSRSTRWVTPACHIMRNCCLTVTLMIARHLAVLEAWQMLVLLVASVGHNRCFPNIWASCHCRFVASDGHRLEGFYGILRVNK